MANRINEYGKYYLAEVVWRGKPYRLQLFFPYLNKPQRGDIQKQADKVYPGCRVYSYSESEYKIKQIPLFLALESERAKIDETLL